MAEAPVKFLAVDDLDENLVALEALLRRDGLEIIKARSGAEALELLLQHDIALALLDVQMPEMNGFELAELMRGLERTRRIPIIFVTALPADEGRRFRGYEAGAVDYLQKPIDPQILQGKTSVFFELARQRNELRQQADRLREALDLLQAHTNNSPLAYVTFDPAFRITAWSEGATRLFGWTARDIIGRSYRDLPWLTGEAKQRLAEIADALREGHPTGRDVCDIEARHQAGGTVYGEWYLSALYGADLRLTSVSVQILDITERRRAEDTQRLLMGELNHRVKNTLATVQAVAAHTLRHARDPKEFSKTFTGRLHSLSKAHALLSAATWSGASLNEILRDQLELGALDAKRFAASGPSLELKPQQALHVAMMLHEMATNAAKYGAHANSTGQIRVEWMNVNGELVLHWIESGGERPAETSRRGFGTTLITESARSDGGSARMEPTADGLIWTVRLPLAVTCEVPSRDGCTDTTPSQPTVALPDDGEHLTKTPSVQGRRVLIIEDEPLVALDIATLLQAADFEIVGTATTVDEALDYIQRSGIDVALLDGNLRGHAVDKVAAALDVRRIPFLFVSGYGEEHLPKEFAGRPILTKPFSSEQLVTGAAGAIRAVGI